MNEPRTVALDLWCRLISGEALDEVQRQRLETLLQQDSLLRAEIEADASVNALLRFTTDIKQTDEQFVQGVLDRCCAMPPLAVPNIEVTPPESHVAGIPDHFDPFKRALESTPASTAIITVVTADQRVNQRTYSKRRQRSKWMALALTASISACLGLIVWSLVDSPIQNERINSNNNLVQKRDISPANVQETLKADGPQSIASLDRAADRGKLPDEAKTAQQPIDIPPLNPAITPAVVVGNRENPSLEQFVTLTRFDNPVWERKSSVGDRLGNEIVRLFAGSVELTFDEGAVVTVDGPIEFRPLSTGQLELRRGRLLASVPQQAIGFTVSTPTSRIVDLGTEFEVAVNEDGESDVQVLKGEVEVEPITLNEDIVQKWRLVPDDFHRASFFAMPNIQGHVPVSASIQGRDGQFKGIVSIDGQRAEFTSSEAFDNVRRRAVLELVRSQENAILQWKEFVDAMQHDMQGSMKLNGQEMKFGSLQDVMQFQNSMFEHAQIPGNNSVESSFSGSININGKVMTFKTREEFEAARRAAFGPAATFGIGDVLRADPPNR